MYKKAFGTKSQISFETEADYYEFLGYLAKNDRSTKLVWEHNDDQGAWAQEGRILFYVVPPSVLRAKLLHTSGVSGIVSRVNCNEYVEHIRNVHQFVPDIPQNKVKIRTTVPVSSLGDFDRGLAL